MKGADIIIGEFYGVSTKIDWDQPYSVYASKAQVLSVAGGKVTIRYDGAPRDTVVRTVDVKAPWEEVERKKVAAREYSDRAAAARKAAHERDRLLSEQWRRVAPEFAEAVAAAGITGLSADYYWTGRVNVTPDTLVLLTGLLKDYALTNAEEVAA
jgi:hypothetical protein